MNPLEFPFASSDVGDKEGTRVTLTPSAQAGAIVGAIAEILGANVGALVGFGVVLILTRIAHKPISATLETSISTQEKDFFARPSSVYQAHTRELNTRCDRGDVSVNTTT